METLSFRAMGTDVHMMVHVRDHTWDEDLERIRIRSAMHDARDRIAELEALLSRFQPSSEISSINRQPGKWIPVNNDTLVVLSLALEAYQSTEGLFNPCLGSALEDIGYDVSFEDIASGLNRHVTVRRPWMAPIRCPFEVNPEASMVCLEPGYKLDLGGIAKGWIVEQAAVVLMHRGYHHFLCSAGGDMVCRGSNGYDAWSVGIADPHDTDKTVLTLHVSDASVATSGTYRRQWSIGGEQVHHLIDPFLGTPVNTDVLSCTVVHPNLVDAEIFAKVALLVGATVAREWLPQQSAVAWVMITESGEVIHSWNS